MPRRSYYRRISRRVLFTRAPRKGTVAIATGLYLVGLFGVLNLLPVPEPYATASLAASGGLLILGSFLRSL